MLSDLRPKGKEMQTELDRDPIISQAEEEALQEIEEAGHDVLAVRAYRSNVGNDYTPLIKWEEWIDDFEESYQGEMSTKEFAEQLADEFMPSENSVNHHEFLVRYFDYEKWERDLFMGDYWENDGYIFRAI
jgi:antirestriction protein